VFPSGERIEPVIRRYFTSASVGSASACEQRSRAAYEHGSENIEEFRCEGADDLSRTLAEVQFAELRASRFFGRLDMAGTKFQIVASGSRSPLLFATEFDRSGCEEIPGSVSLPYPPSSPPPASTEPVVVAPTEPYSVPTPTATGAYTEGSCSGSISRFDSNDDCGGDPRSPQPNSEGCSGDPTSSESNTDGCSGDSTSGESSTDSCSGDSSSDEPSADSCSGDSSDSKYDGDTCSGDSAESSTVRAKRAELRESPARPHVRHLRMSLVTLLAAALGLPLRRRSASR